MTNRIAQARAARTIEEKLKILSEAIKSDDPQERIEASDVLSTLPGTGPVEMLLDRLKADPDPGVRSKIRGVLAEQGTRAINILTDVLKSSKADAAYKAVDVLLEINPQDRAFDALFKTYQDADDGLKLSIDRAMAEAEHEGSISFLMWALKNPDSPYRALALPMLGKLEGTSDLGLLEKKYNIPPESPASVEVASLKTVADFKMALRSKDSEVRVKAMERARDSRKSEYIPALVEGLKDSNLEVRVIAVQALSELDDPSTIEPLIKALDDPHDAVQLSAIKSLLRNADHPRVTGALLRCVKSSNKNVRAIAIAEMAKKTNRNYLKARAENNKKESDVFNRIQTQLVGSLMKMVGKDLESLEQDIRLTVVELIMAIGAGEEIGSLLQELSSNEDPKIRALTMGVLSQLGDVRVVEVLIRGLKDPDHRVQANSIEGLERVGIYKTMNLIVPFLRDRNPRLRANAAKAVYSFGNVVGLRALREMMSDPDVEARSSAAWALGEIKGVEAMKVLIAAAQSEADEGVKRSIYRALMKIRKSREKAAKPEGA